MHVFTFVIRQPTIHGIGSSAYQAQNLRPQNPFELPLAFLIYLLFHKGLPP
jgi:hypothetical protein